MLHGLQDLNSPESESLSPCNPMQFMEFSRAEYWSRWPIPSPGDLPNTGIEPVSPAIQADSLPTELSGKPVDQTWADGSESAQFFFFFFLIKSRAR